jgi:hypothetical protein
MGNDLERTDLDRLLLLHASKSLNEVAEITGLTPEQAATRLSELLETKGKLQDLYRERLLMEELWQMKDDLAARVADSSERNTAGLANAWRQVTSLTLDRFDKARDRNREDITKIDEYHSEILGRVLAVFAAEFTKRFDLADEDAIIVMEELVPGVFQIVQDNTR